MEGLVLLALPLMVLMILTVCGAMFVEAAFVPQQSGTGSEVALAQAVLGAVQGLQFSVEPQRVAAQQTACQHPRPMPRVTMLEASAIAAELQQRGATTVQHIQTQMQSQDCGCPLLTAGGICACQIARPLACVGKCVAGHDMPVGSASGLGEAFSLALRTYLHQEHQDDQVYDLNVALTRVLSAPAEHAVLARSHS